MPSQVWGRDQQEAFEEPYEYDIQKQFAREAKAILERFYKLLNSDRHRYTVDDRSRQKAEWLLSMDALDSLQDCLKALDKKEHRVAGKMFRDVMESMDLAAYFHSKTEKSNKALEKWYKDKIVPNSEYRDYVKKNQSPDVAKRLSTYYSSLSRFIHRSYRVILDGYSRGREDLLVHDQTGELYGSAEGSTSLLVLPQTIASYYVVLANLVLDYASELSELELVSKEDARMAFAESLESETVPRRFLPRRWLADKLSERRTEGKDEQ